MRVIAGGVPAALLGGVVYAQLLAAVGFGGLILAGLLGFAIGRVVKWGARGQSQQPFRGIAMALAAVAIAVGFIAAFGSLLPLGGLIILAYPVAVWLSLRGLQS